MSGQKIPVELLEEDILLEDGILLFSFQVGGNLIECITNFAQDEQVLHLTKLHLQGQAANQVGRATLWQVARRLGRYFGATELHIAGGRRTTGRYKGSVPSPLIIHVPDL